MSKLFLHLLNISITAGWIVLVVVLLRFVLKKAPKWTRVVLWGLVALRLLLPVSIESPLSLVPSEQTVSIATWTLPDTAVGNSEEGSAAQRTTAERVVFQTGFPALNSAINLTMKQSYEHHSTVSTVKTVAGWVWLAGVVGMLFYVLISFLRLRHRVRASVLLEKGVYVCDEIKDPFILGLIVPKIYLPSGMDEQTRAYVLAHERAHLKRFDHIWKPLGFLLLSVYWFNPLLWLAYILLCRDIELACDEKVVKELDDTGKAAYSEALVTASVSRRSIAACPLAFGETGVKSRVKSVLNYKKPAFWIILVAILACIAVAVCFLTMPTKDKAPETAQSDTEPESTPLSTYTPEVVNVSTVKVLQWLDYFYSSDMPWDGTKEITVDAFPNVTFRWTAGSVEAIENGKTRTLFSGMPVWSVYFTDLTGDGKPELCSSVSFGSGIVDEHIVVYNYVNKQSYTLWDRGTFDYHLYTADGALYVGKTPYMDDKQVDYSTLTMHDGVLSCRWQSDGSYTVLNRELHESELIGEWLVEEEKDSDGNVLYTFPQNDLWKEYNFREDGTVVYNETVPISSDYEKAFGHPVEYPYEVHNGYVYIAGDDTSGAFRWGYYDLETHRLTLSYNTAERTVNQTLKRIGEPEPSQKPYIGSWELFKIVDGAQEYDTSFLAAAGGIESDTLVLSEDGTGIRTTAIKGYETNEIALTFTPEQDETILNVVFSESYAYGDVMTARYDSESDTISLYYPDDPTMYTVYIRSGSVIDAPTSKLTIDMLVGNWETEGNTAYDPPFLPGTLTFNKDGSAVLWLKDFLRSGEAIEYTVSLDGNMIWFADQTFASYDPNTDTIRLRLPLQSAGTLVFSRVSPSAEATPQPATSSDLSKEQADAFVNGLSVEFEDGSPYGCDLVCYIDGFGTCLNVGDPSAFERASLRYELLSRNKQSGSIDYAKILSVGELTYYIGDITVFADGDRLVYGEEWNDEYPFADASILVPVNPLMMDRNQSCPKRCCVIRSFDPVNRTVTVSFGLQEEMSADIPGEYVDYSSIETEQITLKVTDETFLTLIGNVYDTLVKPNRFFRFFEEYEFIDLYLFDENNEDASIGFWIGVDGDTLLYLCEMKEV